MCSCKSLTSGHVRMTGAWGFLEAANGARGVMHTTELHTDTAGLRVYREKYI